MCVDKYQYGSIDFKQIMLYGKIADDYIFFNGFYFIYFAILFFFVSRKKIKLLKKYLNL